MVRRRVLLAALAPFLAGAIAWLGAVPLGAAQGTSTYAAIGDSLAAGAGAARGYVPRYHDHLVADTAVPVRLVNLGTGGWTSRDLLSALRSNGTVRDGVAGSDVLTFNIGGNDLLAARFLYKRRGCGGADNQDCLRAVVQGFRDNWDAILEEIGTLRAGRDGVLLSMDIYDPYVGIDRSQNSWPADGGLSDWAVLRAYLDEVNGHIATSLGARGIPSAAVYAAFNGPDGEEDPVPKGYIAADGFHASDAGYTVMADLLHDLGP